MSRYHYGLLFLLCVVGIFNGISGFALSQTLPNLRAEFGLSREASGRFIAVINIGPLLAYFLVRLADRWGRRPIWLISVAAWSAASLASGLLPGMIGFGGAQLVMRMFLLSVPALSGVLAAEEFPAARRGFLVGLVLACGGFGGILCAGLVPILNRTSFGWRLIYVIGAAPLVLVPLALRWLRESALFLRQPCSAGVSSDDGFWSLWRSVHRRRLLHLALVCFLTNVCLSSVILFWKEFALAERGLSELQIGGIIAAASLLGMPIPFLSGQLSDRLGRRKCAVLVYLFSLIGVGGAFSLHRPQALGASLFCAIGGSLALPGLLNTVIAENFPTRVRAAAVAWASTFCGRAAFMLAPLAVGTAAHEVGWGAAVLMTIPFPLIALALLQRIQETAGQTLRDTLAN